MTKELKKTSAYLSKRKLYKQLLIDFYVTSKKADCFKYSASRLSREVLHARSDKALSKVYNRLEISEIQVEALQLRRQRFAPQLAAIDEALLKSALKGSEKAIRLAYERFEGWSSKQLKPFSGDIGTLIVIERTDLNNSLPEKGTQSNINITIDNTKKDTVQKLKCANKPLPNSHLATINTENRSNINSGINIHEQDDTDKVKGTSTKDKNKAPF